MVDVRGVGPYFLQQTLGKGQTGVVRLGIHSQTKKKVAVKIVDKNKIQPNVLAKVEREITIMKLIEHHNVLQLYDVYESRKNLFLVLEYVGGGELFDYLVSKGRLHILEAKKFFRQIVSAIHYCHHHLVCHRDLKPENLLLDEKKNIKIADFGMASVQMENDMLETSCGSPHYACPEVVRGVPYDGRKADTWSCGVILYALIVGCLPFDDDNLRILLEKVKKGTFTIPAFVPPDCVDLLHKMIKVNPEQRFTLGDVQRHPFYTKNAEEIPPEPPLPSLVDIKDLVEDELDEDVVNSMNCLGCFKDRAKLTNSLLVKKKNVEKVIYFLLLDRKSRRPSTQDDVKALIYTSEVVKKRVDSPNLNIARRSVNLTYQNGTYSMQRRPRAATTMSHKAEALTPNRRPSSLVVNTPPGSPWRDRFFTLTKNIFHRSGDLSSESEDSPQSPPIEMVKRSWFPGSLFNVGHPGSSLHRVLIKDRTLTEINADLIHSFLTMSSKVSHVPLENSKYRLEYKKQGRFLLPASPLCTVMEISVEEPSSDELVDEMNRTKESLQYEVVFTFESGSHRKFRKLCQKVQEALVNRGINRSSNSSGSVNDLHDFLLPSGTNENSPKTRARISVKSDDDENPLKVVPSQKRTPVRQRSFPDEDIMPLRTTIL
ncbi:serine/threonine-protein kinase BRSK2-like [Clytia hemisphaerica]|uniref:non-specific serine/threonine protein kinase n=1 Tax=Clytia hemisphaerica TaxID=252671 RepID=A0A7M5WXU0_9CNID